MATLFCSFQVKGKNPPARNELLSSLHQAPVFLCLEYGNNQYDQEYGKKDQKARYRSQAGILVILGVDEHLDGQRVVSWPGNKERDIHLVKRFHKGKER
jgi:hypothetical protein